MAYMNRRSAGPPQSPAQAPTVGSIGQRRPVANTNFQSGGQLNTQNKTGGQQQAQRTPAAQNANTNANFRNQNQGYQTQAATPQKQQQQKVPQQQQQQQKVAQQKPPQQQQKPVQPQQVQQKAPQQQPKTVQPQQVVQAPAKVETPPLAINPPNPEVEDVVLESMDVEEEGQKKKPFWNKGGGKISKKEKMRRRNIRLSKMLQPKNAVMILNELVKDTSYNVAELPVKVDGNQYKASVVVEDIEHVGYGRSKIHAKNSAAEVALKHLIQSNRLSEMKKDDDGNEKMEVTEDSSQPPLPWQHVASFALFKLFTSWGDDPNKGNLLPMSANVTNEIGPKTHENKPAKKMPANPESINPLMLINQMLPHAQYEELGRDGVPPNIMYSYRCTVGDNSFIGTGTNKKLAKKMAAFAACHKMLNIDYPKEIYTPPEMMVEY